jgi:predicted  nucleic acid-binding Zn-ribbon protein
LGLCGDAVKATTQQLEDLWQLQKLILDQRRLISEAKRLSSGESLAEQEQSLVDLGELTRNQLLVVEAAQAEKKRIDSDLELVEKRIQQDQARLNSSSSTKDITGIQHEIDGLLQRKAMLEDTELGILSELEQQKKRLDELSSVKQAAEEQLQSSKAELRGRLDQMKQENLQLNEQIERLRGSAPTELLELFDKKLSKGTAIGRLVRSACNACNMNLNSTAIADISAIPVDEVAMCPECSAIVIRA